MGLGGWNVQGQLVKVNVVGLVTVMVSSLTQMVVGSCHGRVSTGFNTDASTLAA